MPTNQGVATNTSLQRDVTPARSLSVLSGSEERSQIGVQSGRITALDGLRGLAVLLVVFSHFYAGFLTPAYGPLYYLSNIGWAGVDLFFVLSGFLIGGILLENRASENYYKTFYIRRICRIFPLYFLVLTLFLFLPGNSGARPPMWTYYLYLQNFWSFATGNGGPRALDVTWSLAIEEQAYLLLPFLIHRFSRRTLTFSFLALLIALPVLRLNLLQYYRFSNLAVVLCRPDGILLGVLAALWIRRPGAAARLDENRKFIVPILAVLGAAIASISLIKVWSPLWLPTLATFGYSVVPAFFAMLVVVVVSIPAGRLAAVARFRLMRSFGEISYGMYLYHILVFQSVWGFITMHQLHIRYSPRMTTIIFGIVILISQISWTLMEKPILKLGHRFRY